MLAAVLLLGRSLMACNVDYTDRRKVKVDIMQGAGATFKIHDSHNPEG
jgi:hypothetical protein